MPICDAVLRSRWILACLFSVTLGGAHADEPAVQPVVVSAFYELDLATHEWRKLFEVPEYRSCGSLRMASDGKFIVFDGYKSQIGETLDQARVLRFSLDGAHREVICQGAMPSLSPDGCRIACSRYGDHRGVWVMNVDGTNARNLDPKGWGVQWSPSSTEVSYTQGNRLIVVDVDSNASRDVFNGQASPYTLIYFNMAWSPDGERLAILGDRTRQTDRELAFVNSKGAEFEFRVRLRDKVSAALCWSPAGDALFYPVKAEHGRYEIRRLTVAGHEPPVRVPGQPQDRNQIGVCVTPDGKRLIILSFEMKHPQTGTIIVPAS